ncbi:MAG: DNA-3-methyladenine glycosylase [Planctomycetota bacterium]|jgi:DNA-3-methyladenine glycosylase
MSAKAAGHQCRFDAFDRDSATVARRLLGQRLVRVLRGRRVSGLIVETEAYLGAADKAAHTYNGRRTARNESMYLAGGHAYVYFTYGMHYCLNVVCGRAGEGVAVLLRALEPQEGQAMMWSRRSRCRREAELCAGPARLTAALSIDRGLDGEDLRTSRRLFIEQVRSRALPGRLIVAGPRVGVGYAEEWTHRPLRFYIKGSPSVSRTR